MSVYQLLKQLLSLTLSDQLKHEEALEDLPEEKVEFIVNSVAAAVVENGLATPAVIALEIFRPASFIVGQLALVSGPLVAPWLGHERVNGASAFLNNRKNVGKLIDRMQELQAEDLHKKKMSKGI